MRDFTSAILIGLCFISVTALADESAATTPRFVKAWGHEGTVNCEFFVVNSFNHGIQKFAVR